MVNLIEKEIEYQLKEDWDINKVCNNKNKYNPKNKNKSEKVHVEYVTDLRSPQINFDPHIMNHKKYPDYFSIIGVKLDDAKKNFCRAFSISHPEIIEYYPAHIDFLKSTGSKDLFEFVVLLEHTRNRIDLPPPTIEYEKNSGFKDEVENDFTYFCKLPETNIEILVEPPLDIKVKHSNNVIKFENVREAERYVGEYLINKGKKLS